MAVLPALFLSGAATGSSPDVVDGRGPVVTPLAPAPGSWDVPFLATRIVAAWEDDLSGVEPLSGRMTIRDASLGLPAIDVTGQATRTDSGISFTATVLRPCAVHEIVVTVSDRVGNPSAPRSWMFRTAGCQ